MLDLSVKGSLLSKIRIIHKPVSFSAVIQDWYIFLSIFRSLDWLCRGVSLESPVMKKVTNTKLKEIKGQ